MLKRGMLKGTNVQIDTIALLQGVIDARSALNISNDLADRIISMVNDISYLGPVNRSVCDYDKFLVNMGKIEAKHWVELSILWEKHLGESLSSGIIVANS